MVSSIANLVCDVPHKLPNDLRLRIFTPRHFRRWRDPAHTRKKRLRILGNKEILVKSQIWVETFKSPFQKLNFGNSRPKTRKSRIKLFLTCLVLLDFSILFQILCPGLKVQRDHLLVHCFTLHKCATKWSFSDHPSLQWSLMYPLREKCPKTEFVLVRIQENSDHTISYFDINFTHFGLEKVDNFSRVVKQIC